MVSLTAFSRRRNHWLTSSHLDKILFISNVFNVFVILVFALVKRKLVMKLKIFVPFFESNSLVSVLLIDFSNDIWTSRRFNNLVLKTPGADIFNFTSMLLAISDAFFLSAIDKLKRNLLAKKLERNKKILPPFVLVPEKKAWWRINKGPYNSVF